MTCGCMRYYEIDIPSAVDLQRDSRNPTGNPTPSLYALSSAIIGTKLEKKNNKKDKKKGKDNEDLEDLRIFGWGNVPLSYEQVLYAVLDARLGFEIATWL